MHYKRDKDEPFLISDYVYSCNEHTNIEHEIINNINQEIFIKHLEEFDIANILTKTKNRDGATKDKNNFNNYLNFIYKVYGIEIKDVILFLDIYFLSAGKDVRYSNMLNMLDDNNYFQLMRSIK